jgi:hypothetical protein
MTTDNPNPKTPRHKNRRMGKVNLMPYNVKIDPQTVVLIKQIQTEHGLKSQGEVITLAVRLMINEVA